MSDVTVRAARVEDHLAISVLLDTAFEGPVENRLVKDLRDQNLLALELVAEDTTTGAIVGHIAFTWLEAPKDWIALAPISVRVELRERGIGSKLVRAGLAQLAARNVPGVVTLGDLEFYERFGFSLDAARNLHSDYPDDMLLLCPMQEGISGIFTDIDYPRPFRYG